MVLSGSKGLADAVLFLFCISGSHQEIDGTKNLIGANPLVVPALPDKPHTYCSHLLREKLSQKYVLK
jgi:hypothetical protein